MVHEEEDNEDQEISIDFRKIKNFFKRKQTKEHTNDNLDPNESPQDTKEQPPADSIKKHQHDKDTEEDNKIDFSKMENTFKRDKEKTKEGIEDEVSFDTKNMTSFLTKQKKILVPLILIIIAMAFSTFLRIQPAYLPITDEWAKNSVHNFFKDQIKGQVSEQYPNMPDPNKDVIVDEEFQKLLKERKSEVDEQIKATSDYFKSRLQDDNGQTYLLAIDPYFWMRHVKNIIENGHPGDEMIDGVKWDNHMYAPIGRTVPFDMFNAYFGAYVYKFASFFNRDVPLMTIFFYIPVILSALAVIPAFFIAKRFGGNFGGFVAALVIAVHPAILTRTAGGFADTDAYNVLFPLFITLAFLTAFEAENLKKRSLYAAIAGILVGLYSFAWGGWWYIFDFIVASTIIYIGYYIILHRKELKKNIISIIKIPAIKNTLIVLLIFVIMSGIFVSIFVNFYYFQRAPINPFRFSKLKEVGIIKLWPNVYTTVAEQNPASLGHVINQIGTGRMLLFLIGLVGISLAMIKKDSKKLSDFSFVVGSTLWFAIILLTKPENLNIFLVWITVPFIIKFLLIIKQNDFEVDTKAAILLFIWLLSTIYASTKGIRFSLLVVPAFAVGFGITLGIAFKYLNKWINSILHIKKWITKIALFIILLLIIGISPKPPFCTGSMCGSAFATAKNEIPSMNDAWYNALSKIREESAQDAIINSWWDFGHWFKMVGDRAVTFDGTSQNTPMAHWIGKVLLTDDEDTAIGILRMLDCGSRKSGDMLDEITNDTAMSVDILYEIILQDKREAKKTLLDNGINSGVAEEILKLTHCDPPENFFIASEDMISKSGVWGHFGSWNFDRALIYNTLKKKEYKNNRIKSIDFLKKRLNYSQQNAESLFREVQSIKTNDEANSWIAPWPSYQSGLSGCAIEDNIAKCGNGMVVDLTTAETMISTQQGEARPHSLVYLTPENLEVRRFNDSNIEVSAALIPRGDSFVSIMSSPEIAASIFNRLFYMEGHGLKHFKLFAHEKQVTGGDIYVYKVDWEGQEKNVLEFFKAAENQDEEITEELTEETPKETEDAISNETDENDTKNGTA